MLAVGVSIWSLCTVATPWAASWGTAPLLACRVALGVGEGVRACLLGCPHTCIQPSTCTNWFKQGSSRAVYNLQLPIPAGITMLRGT